MNFGSRILSGFNKIAPRISKGIGQVANISRGIGDIVKTTRNIGSIANQISGGQLSRLPYADKIKDAANKIEQGVNMVSGNEDKAQQALNTLSRKINA